MTRKHARIQGGKRIRMPAPYIHGSFYTMISAIGLAEVKTCLYGMWSANGDIFKAFIRDSLLPALTPGDIVIMDNVSFHKVQGIEELIRSVRAEVIFLPPYSPDFNPIENMWSKIKAILRKYGPRTHKEFKRYMKIAFGSITPDDLQGWYQHCGYSISTI